MRNVMSSVALGLSGLMLSACSNEPAPTQDSMVLPETPAATIPKYSAEAFFATTTYGLVGSAAHAFSADGGSLLVSSVG